MFPTRDKPIENPEPLQSRAAESQFPPEPDATLLSDYSSADAPAAGRLAGILSGLKSKQSDRTAGDSVDESAGSDSEHYELGGIVAQGGMGAIIEARDLNIRRNVAMKVMLNPDTASETNVLRFVEEAQITGQLEHPGVVPVHQLGVNSSGNVFYTMKFVNGLNLGEILSGLVDGRKDLIERFPLARLLNIFLKVCDTMAFAHSRRVIHRDLKPDNIMVGEYGEVLVLDWGLGKVLNPVSSDVESDLRPSENPDEISSNRSTSANGDSAISEGLDSRIESIRSDSVHDTAKTLHGAVMGTPVYMPPEQARGEIEQLDERADVYSLGAILYNILTLQPPVTGDSAIDVLAKVVTGEITAPDKRSGPNGGEPLRHCPDGKVPAALSAVTMKALSTRPEDRYASVPELQREIESWQSGFATQAEDAGKAKQLWLLIQRNKGLTASLTAVILALTIGMSIALIQRNNAVDANQRATESYQKLMSEEAALARISHDAAPEFVDKAIVLLQRDQRDEAVAAVETAIGLYPHLGSAWFQKGRLHLDAGEFEEAAAALSKAVQYAGDSDFRSTAQSLASLALEARSFAGEDGGELLPERLLSLATSLEEQGDSVLAGRIYARTGDRKKGLQVRVLAAIRQLEDVNPGLRFDRADGFATEFAYFYWHHVTKDEGLELGLPRSPNAEKLVNVTPLAGLPVRHLRLRDTGISDLSAVREMPLRILDVANTKILSLKDLVGLPLESLDISNNRITDISPLATLPLRRLAISDMEIDSIEPIRRLRLEDLDLHNTKNVRDLGPAGDMPLTRLDLRGTGITDVSSIRGKPLTELALPAGATDLSVLRGMPLTSLDLSHTQTRDIAPLAGLNLQSLRLSSAALEDFRPLQDVQSKTLDISSDTFDDLNLIAHMPLDALTLNCPKVVDLSPLRGMKLRKLTLRRCQIEDLDPVADMPLQLLSLTDMPVDDLTPLSTLRLSELTIINCPVDDITPISGQPLSTVYLIRCPKLHDLRPLTTLERLAHVGIPEHCRDIEFLRDMKSIYYLNTTNQHKNVATFWEEFDAGTE